MLTISPYVAALSAPYNTLADFHPPRPQSPYYLSYNMMRMSIHDRFTPSRIRETLRDGIYVQPSDVQDYPWEFVSTTLDHDLIPGRLTPYNNMVRLQRATKICRKLLKLVQNPEYHLERLDEEFARLLEFNIINFEGEEEETVAQTIHLLSRLPPDPPPYWELDAARTCSELDRRYFVNQTHTGRLENLATAHFFSKNVIRMALRAVLWPGSRPSFISYRERSNFSGPFSEFISMVSDLLEASLEMKPGSERASGHMLILRSFLWTTWHRAISIHHWHVSQLKQDLGASPRRAGRLQLRGGNIIRRVQNAASLDDSGIPNLPPYMCKWAFRLMSSQQESVGLDFRRVVSRYQELFGHLPPRCIIPAGGQPRQCSGENPGLCQRFVGARIEDQSTHAPGCQGGQNCYRVFWNEESYRRETGGRAVRVDGLENGFLTYCTASAETMAISHVWSHGQGGRPENAPDSTGFNVCLHFRYSRIARRYGCTSYWMDTPCIPQDHELRAEAIAQINNVFSTSRLTLLCDRDIMTIDVRSPTIALQESILAALLVCDWNVRAWTLLEAVKGDKNMHLLCKDNRVLRLADILRTIHREGSVDLVNTYLSAHHLIRPGIRDQGSVRVYNSRGHSYMRATRAFNIEEAASLLSHRHASRGGDQTVIWSILVEFPEICYSPEQFWSHATGVRTGFLMSHAPRVKGRKGLSWAPGQPDLPLQKPDDQPGDELQCYSYPGDGSAFGEALDSGLLASWMIFEVNHAALLWTCLLCYLSASLEGAMLVLSGTFGNWLKGTMAYVNQGSLDHITRVSSYWFEMMFIASATRRLYTQHVAKFTVESPHIAFIRPMRDVTGEVLPYLYSGDAERVLLAVISSDDGERWVWQGVVEWDKAVPLPPFMNKRFVIE